MNPQQFLDKHSNQKIEVSSNISKIRKEITDKNNTTHTFDI